jgi:dihydroorotase
LSRITPFHGRRTRGLPLHTLVRGRFVMRERELVAAARGWGRSVHTIQQLPAPTPRNTDDTMTAIVRVPTVAGRATGHATPHQRGKR